MLEVGDGAPDDRCRALAVIGGRRESSENAEGRGRFLTCQKLAISSNVLGETPEKRSVSVLDSGRCEVGMKTQTDAR